MRSSNSNKTTRVYSFSESFCSANYRNAQFGGAHNFRLRPRNCGRDDHCAHSLHVRGVVPLLHGDAKAGEILERGRCEIAAADRCALSHKQFCESIHPRAGDSDEVNWAPVGRVQQ
jgi:hypothetical protein